jgi:hypothetical protein
MRPLLPLSPELRLRLVPPASDRALLRMRITALLADPAVALRVRDGLRGHAEATGNPVPDQTAARSTGEIPSAGPAFSTEPDPGGGAGSRLAGKQRIAPIFSAA